MTELIAGEPTQGLLERILEDPDRYHYTTIETGWGKVCGEPGVFCSHLRIYRISNNHGRPLTVVFGDGEHENPDPWSFEGWPDPHDILWEYLCTISSHGAPKDVRTATDAIAYCFSLPRIKRTG